MTEETVVLTTVEDVRQRKREPLLRLTVSDAPRDPTSRRAVHPGRFAR